MVRGAWWLDFPKNILKWLEKGVEIILQLCAKVVVEIGTSRFEGCVVLHRLPVNGVACMMSEMDATTPEIQHCLLVAVTRILKNAVNLEIITHMKNYCIDGAAHFHLYVHGTWDLEQVFAVFASHVPRTCSILTKLNMVKV